MEPREGAWWDSLRIGIGPPLLKTEYGWLLVYHGVKETVTGGMYRVGLALLDLHDPSRVLRRCPDWVFGPLAEYERVGDVPNEKNLSDPNDPLSKENAALDRKIKSICRGC